MFRTILLPIDLNEASSWERALPIALELCRAHGAKLHVMTVVPDFGMAIVGSFFPEGYEDRALAGADTALHTPETNAALGDAILRAAAEAQRGDQAFLTALMMLVVSPYGRTVEGSEWINELLWETLAVQPQASIDSLADLPTEIRNTAISEVYTAPIHDGFDFPTILESLERIKVPTGFDAETASILDSLRPLAR